mmetsp:Transcript_34629/g.99796  ORF Transcript_34629/g.99796 Transcript_34629/m.99796 type:complete len:241 (+) Transcript_34629:100-822(+)
MPRAIDFLMQRDALPEPCLSAKEDSRSAWRAPRLTLPLRSSKELASSDVRHHYGFKVHSDKTRTSVASSEVSFSYESDSDSSSDSEDEGQGPRARGRARDFDGEVPPPRDEAWARIRTPSPERLAMTASPSPAGSDGLLVDFGAVMSPISRAGQRPFGDDAVCWTTPTTTAPACFCPGVELSVGSAGHPFHCGGPCKFALTRRGCKEGGACQRCHCCRWSKSFQRRAKDAFVSGFTAGGA